MARSRALAEPAWLEAWAVGLLHGRARVSRPSARAIVPRAPSPHEFRPAPARADRKTSGHLTHQCEAEKCGADRSERRRRRAHRTGFRGGREAPRTRPGRSRRLSRLRALPGFGARRRADRTAGSAAHSIETRGPADEGGQSATTAVETRSLDAAFSRTAPAPRSGATALPRSPRGMIRSG